MLTWLKKKLASANPDINISRDNADLARSVDHSALGHACRIQGNELLEQGKLNEAATSYLKAIDHNPNDLGAYINLAFVRMEQKQFKDAETFLTLAHKLDANDFDVNFLLSSLAKIHGKLDEAIRYLRVALALKPSAANVYIELCQLLVSVGQLEQARACLREGIERCQSTSEREQFEFFLGNLFLKENRFDDAITCYGKASQSGQAFAELHKNRGLALQGLGKIDEAVIELQKALTLRGNDVDVICLLARIDLSRGLYNEGLLRYRSALQWQSDSAEVLCGIGDALTSLKRHEEAIQSYDRVLTLNANHVYALNNRGIAFECLKLFDKALASYDKALQCQPDFVDALFNRGNVLSHFEDDQRAIDTYQRVIELDPRYARAYSNIGVILIRKNNYQEALRYFTTALEIDPRCADAHYTQSLCRLVLGDFENGWKQHEWRWQTDQFAAERNQFTQTLWLGDAAIEGKTILLHSEQGFGDTIHFFRYVKLVVAMGAKVLLRVQPALETLLRPHGIEYQLVQKHETLPKIDFQCPLLSLPLAFHTTLETIPAESAYLHADSTRRAKWNERLENTSKPRIGLVWSGNAAHVNDKNRSISLDQLSKILVPDVTFVSLQKELRERDKELLQTKLEIMHFGNELTDFTETAALIDNMDLIISVDTSVAHLAGALGKPVWVLLPFRPDWRWLLERNDSPWYPSMRIFRQAKPGDWQGVLEQVLSELKSYVDA